MKLINIIVLSILLLIINSNLWDNIYSQSKSPHSTLPDNFELLLLNEKDNTIAGDLLMSTEHNLTKFSFILDESNGQDAFIQLLIDFNAGRLYIDTQEKCVYQYINLIEQLCPKFILYAYDLLSYFSEDSNDYHYIVINPLEISEVEEDDMNKIPSLLKYIFLFFGQVSKKYNTIYDKDFYGDFIIDKNKQTIRAVTIKTKNAMTTFNTNFRAYDIEKEKFNGIHKLEDCVEYSG